MSFTRILTQRLVELYDPYRALGLSKDLRLDDVEPLRFCRGAERGPGYDRGRIRAFVDLLRDGWETEPIELDNVCYGLRVLPEPILLDGHHRLIAHVIAGRKRITCEYGGRVDLLRYLQGKRKTCPRQ